LSRAKIPTVLFLCALQLLVIFLDDHHLLNYCSSIIAFYTPPPTSSPTTPLLNVNATKKPINNPTDNPGIPVTFTGTATFSSDGLRNDQKREFVAIYKAGVEKIACQPLELFQSCDLNVLKVDGETVGTTRIRGRRLLSLNRKLQDSSIHVEYEVVLTVVCSGPECSDAESVKEISNSVYNQVTGKLGDALNDGSFVQEIINASSA